MLIQKTNLDIPQEVDLHLVLDIKDIIVVIIILVDINTLNQDLLQETDIIIEDLDQEIEIEKEKEDIDIVETQDQLQKKESINQDLVEILQQDHIIKVRINR